MKYAVKTLLVIIYYLVVAVSFTLAYTAVIMFLMLLADFLTDLLNR